MVWFAYMSVHCVAPTDSNEHCCLSYCRYSLVYGSLASVIILLVWLYLCGNILILGSVVNYVIYSHKKERQ